jgi:hypothetical protein
MWRVSCWMSLFQDVTWLIHICNVIFAIQNASFNIFWCWMSLMPDVTWLYGHTCVRDTSRVGYDMSHCNTLQHTATHCNTLQYTATHCNTCTRHVPRWIRHVTPVNEFCHTFEWVMLHIWMSLVARMNESYHKYDGVIWMSHGTRWMSHVTQMNESTHMDES